MPSRKVGKIDDEPDSPNTILPALLDYLVGGGTSSNKKIQSGEDGEIVDFDTVDQTDPIGFFGGFGCKNWI